MTYDELVAGYNDLGGAVVPPGIAEKILEVALLDDMVRRLGIGAQVWIAIVETHSSALLALSQGDSHVSRPLSDAACHVGATWLQCLRAWCEFYYAHSLMSKPEAAQLFKSLAFNKGMLP